MNETDWLKIAMEDMEWFLDALDSAEHECEGTEKILVAGFAKKASQWHGFIEQHLETK